MKSHPICQAKRGKLLFNYFYSPTLAWLWLRIVTITIAKKNECPADIVLRDIPFCQKRSTLWR